MLSKIRLRNALLGSETASRGTLVASSHYETSFKATSAVNPISYILWSVWLIAFGIALLLL